MKTDKDREVFDYVALVLRDEVSKPGVGGWMPVHGSLSSYTAATTTTTDTTLIMTF
jgi:hypothetical protein